MSYVCVISSGLECIGCMDCTNDFEYDQEQLENELEGENNSE